MKKLVIEFRQYLAEKLLSLAWGIAPKSKDGVFLKTTVYDYFLQFKIQKKCLTITNSTHQASDLS